MDRKEWYATYREVRTAVDGDNLFPRAEMADIALDMARHEIREARKRKRFEK